MKYRCIKSNDCFKYIQGEIYNVKLSHDIHKMFHDNWYILEELNYVIPEKYLINDFRTIVEDRKKKIIKL